MDLDAIVVGAGQAGLAAAYWLKRTHRRFVVLERGQVGETWRSQRWDSFRLNTPRWMNALPGAPYDGPDRGRYPGTEELIASFEDYVRRFELPVRTGVTVTHAAPVPGGFRVRARANGGEEDLRAAHLVVAAGILRVPRIPAWADELPREVHAIPSSSYRNADALPDGAVLIVGGGQTGCQIAEDLAEAGRTVHLCTSRVGRFPRRYRGRDMVDWWDDMKFFETHRRDVEDPAMIRAAQPLASGIGGYGYTMSLQRLARRGVRLLGRALGVEQGTVILDDSLPETVRFADERSAAVRQSVDDFIARAGIDAPPPEPDPDDESVPGLGEDAPRRLDLEDAGVRTVIWSTGFTGDFSWIDAPVTDADGAPRHEDGASPVPGLHFVGFPWLSRRASGIVHGVGADAKRTAERIAAAG